MAIGLFQRTGKLTRVPRGNGGIGLRFANVAAPGPIDHDDGIHQDSTDNALRGIYAPDAAEPSSSRAQFGRDRRLPAQRSDACEHHTRNECRLATSSYFGD